MFKPSTRNATRSSTSPRSRTLPGFAETQFLHGEDDEDYSGFAPTQMFEDGPAEPLAAVASARERQGIAEGPSRVAPARGETLTEEAAMPASWVTSRWVEAQEAKAHDAARQARAVIAAQRRVDGDRRVPSAAGAPAQPQGWMQRVRAVVQRVLPVDFYSVLPLFICVSLTMALISAVLPLFDKP